MTSTAYFAAGCFWGVQAAFETLAGVEATQVGYMGGHTLDPTYEEVCGGQTEHAEAVKVVYREEEISFPALLALFWHSHDPSQLNRQGPDIGRQYRSAIFCADQQQLTDAQASKLALQQAGQKIVTEIIPAPLPLFYAAEEYHQNYFAKTKKGA